MDPVDEEIVSVAEKMDLIIDMEPQFAPPPKATTFAERERDRVEVAFIEECGRRDYLKTALSQSNSLKLQNFFLDLANPEAKNFSVSELARHHKISAVELADLMRDFNKSKTILNMMAEMPNVGRDVVKDAKSTKLCCNRCDGAGTIDSREYESVPDEKGRYHRTPKPMKCPQCSGKGYTRKAGDKNARQLAFEVTGLITKQPLVAIDQRQISIEQTLGELESIDGT